MKLCQLNPTCFLSFLALTLVGYDPEGYFLEWDTFLPVEGNERLLELLRRRTVR